MAIPLLSSPLQPDFIILVIFSSKSIKQGHELDLMYLSSMLAESRRLGTIGKCQKRTLKVAFISGRSGTQYVAMVTKNVTFKLCSASSKIVLP